MSTDRVAISVRFAPELHDRLVAAADERVVSVNLLVNKACADFLDRLVPVEQMRWTRDVEEDAS